MSSKLAQDPRIDPRIKAVLGEFEIPIPGSVNSRDELLAEEASAEGLANAAALREFMEMMDNEEIAPSRGLRTHTERVASLPDRNEIRIRIIRPKQGGNLPCVYYIHGGGMAMFSCFDGNYRAWARILAAQGIVVAMVDFRNALRPSSVPDVEPFPAGLNDCVSGFRWLHANARKLRIDPRRIVIAGESGGGNLAIATTLKLVQSGEGDLVKGLYALCPYLSGELPLPEYPSSTENEGIFISLHNNRGVMGYGIEAYRQRNPLAWPRFASTDDVKGFPPVVISVNECDPLRDEGIAFFRLLLTSGVRARCRQVMGTTHATEVFPICCPDISRDAAIAIAELARS